MFLNFLPLLTYVVNGVPVDPLVTAGMRFRFEYEEETNAPRLRRIIVLFTTGKLGRSSSPLYAA
jgi:hypothetical protein